MASTSTDIANQALRRIGAATISDITSTTEKGALVANEFYADTVKEVSRAHPWNCLKRRATLKAFGKEPAFEWGYRYALPSDFLRMEKLNGVNAWEPQDFFEIEGFYDSLVTNGTFTNQIDDWTDADTGDGASTISGDQLRLEVTSSGTAKRTQSIHTLTDSDHDFSISVASLSGSAAVDFEIYAGDDTDEATNLVPVASQQKASTGTHTFTFFPQYKSCVLKISNSGAGVAVVDTCAVTCSEAPSHVLLTDADSARVSYISSRTAVTEYDSLLTECLVLLLASKLVVSMRQDEALTQALLAEYNGKLSAARRIDGNEQGRRQYDIAGGSRWVNSRWRSTND